ncbi:putative alginate O-acetylase AlgI [Bordetella sputigena]|uniref:MBOAT family O-acyltransferase n=1 Tax=Bordetella sputigena TaxID=1416810 RepID=UPI0039EE4235
MLFNSFEFLGFFLVFLAVFFAVPAKRQPLVLLVASYLFYMGWRPSFAILLAFTTIIDYTTALAMEEARGPRGRRLAMIIALSINLGILATVKYLDFVIANVVGISGFFGIEIPAYALGLILPVGISFYTFQSVGYTLDVYNRRLPAERNFLTYAQYVSFFPQLVAGPIERGGHMLPQFRRRHVFRYDNLVSGGWLIGYGLFKKMCIADAISPFVAGVYADPGAYAGGYHALAAVLFAVQIYCDFSGYSDIARGAARIMDYELMINFRQPYFSASLTEFWRRWHISLSSWFRDYLYMPLGGSRGKESTAVRNIIIVFVVSGIWHGAAWTFVAWGALHGLGLVLERWFRGTAAGERLTAAWPGLATAAGRTWTLMLVLAGWIFFRAATLPNAVEVFRHLGAPGTMSYGVFNMLGLSAFQSAVLAASIALLFVVDFHLVYRPDRLKRLAAIAPLNTVAGVALGYYVLLFGVFGRTEFIYFQF